MKSERPKVLHPICGKPMLHYPLQAAKQAGFNQLAVVVGHQAERVQQTFADENVNWVEQTEQLGTGHALLCAAESLAGFSGTLLLLCGDVPLLQADTLAQLYKYHKHEKATVTVLTAEMSNPTGYGRVIRNNEQVLKIEDALLDDVEELGLRRIFLLAPGFGRNTFDSGFGFVRLEDWDERDIPITEALGQIQDQVIDPGRRSDRPIIDHR